MLFLFLIYKKYSSFYHVNKRQASQFFQLSFFEVKIVNPFGNYVHFWDIRQKRQKNILHHFAHYNFL